MAQSTKSWSLTQFIKEFGLPEYRTYKDHVACVMIDNEGNETFLNPGRTGCSITFTAAEQAKKDMIAKKDDLRVLEGTTELGSTCYTLVDKAGDFEPALTTSASDWGL